MRSEFKTFSRFALQQLLNSERNIYRETAFQYNVLSRNRELKPLNVICGTILQYILKQTQTVQKQSEVSKPFLIQLGLSPLSNHKKIILFLFEHPKELWKHIHPFIFIPRSDFGLYRMWYPASVHSFLQKEYKREREFWKYQSQTTDLALFTDEHHY